MSMDTCQLYIPHQISKRYVIIGKKNHFFRYHALRHKRLVAVSIVCQQEHERKTPEKLFHKVRAPAYPISIRRRGRGVKSLLDLLGGRRNWGFRLTRLFFWRPRWDLNPCYRRESIAIFAVCRAALYAVANLRSSERAESQRLQDGAPQWNEDRPILVCWPGAYALCALRATTSKSSSDPFSMILSPPTTVRRKWLLFLSKSIESLSLKIVSLIGRPTALSTGRNTGTISIVLTLPINITSTSLAASPSPRATEPRPINLNVEPDNLFGATLMMVGLFLWVSPYASVQALAIIAGIHGIFWGILDLRLASHLEDHCRERKALRILGGVAMGIGILLIVGPELSIRDAVMLLACYLTYIGIYLVMIGIYIFHPWKKPSYYGRSAGRIIHESRSTHIVERPRECQ